MKLAKKLMSIRLLIDNLNIRIEYDKIKGK